MTKLLVPRADLAYVSMAPSPGFRVGPARSLAARTHLQIPSSDGRLRRVTLFSLARGGARHFVAMDSICYHAAGALGLNGDLSVLGGRVCVTCPLHFFRFDASTGERIVRHDGNDDDNDDGNGDPASFEKPHWRRHEGKHRTMPGPMQRTHSVLVKDGVVYVVLDERGEVPSDMYAFAPDRDPERENGKKRQSRIFFGSDFEW